MLKAISVALLAASAFAPASPGVNRVDAYARASGNRKPQAIAIGRALFRTQWPAQVLTVYADGIGPYEVAGLRISGRNFHSALTRPLFAAEVAALATETFAAAPVQEVDIWAVVPLRVGKDVVVAGDLARPTSRTVFSVSAHRGESAAALQTRILAGRGVYFDQDWVRTALK